MPKRQCVAGYDGRLSPVHSSAMHREPLTIKLMWATLASLVVSLLPVPELQAWLEMWPLDLRAGTAAGPLAWLGAFMPWQLATHLLLNPSLWSLVFIALTLYQFGGQLEAMWGARRYGLFLLTCAAGSALLQLAVSTAAYAAGLTPYVPVEGASGVMYGVLLALGYIAPYSRVRLLFPPIEMEMRTLVIVFAVIAFVFGVRYDGLWAQFGFLGGMLFAWLHIRYWRGEPPFRRRPPTRPKRHLRSV
jgi:membrane associated rhomboid family serine protease